MITESFSEKENMSKGGRGVWDRKTRVDEARSIDILDLQRNGIFSRGSTWNWTSSWSRNGVEVASITYCVEFDGNGPAGLRFMYTLEDNKTGVRKQYNYLIPVVSTACNYGGKRWWYTCPLILNGKYCQCRCRIVYMPPEAKYFGCRECHQLSYESRQRHRNTFYEGFERPRKTAEAVEKKLARTRSLDKKIELSKKYAHATEKIALFADILTNRKPKIIYREK
jgi:hypothetical protein